MLLGTRRVNRIVGVIEEDAGDNQQRQVIARDIDARPQRTDPEDDSVRIGLQRFDHVDSASVAALYGQADTSRFERRADAVCDPAHRRVRREESQRAPAGRSDKRGDRRRECILVFVGRTIARWRGHVCGDKDRRVRLEVERRTVLRFQRYRQRQPPAQKVPTIVDSQRCARQHERVADVMPRPQQRIERGADIERRGVQPELRRAAVLQVAIEPRDRLSWVGVDDRVRDAHRLFKRPFNVARVFGDRGEFGLLRPAGILGAGRGFLRKRIEFNLQLAEARLRGSPAILDTAPARPRANALCQPQALIARACVAELSVELLEALPGGLRTPFARHEPANSVWLHIGKRQLGCPKRERVPASGIPGHRRG